MEAEVGREHADLGPADEQLVRGTVVHEAGRKWIRNVVAPEREPDIPI